MKKRFNRASLYFSLAMIAAALLIGSLAKAQTNDSKKNSPVTPAGQPAAAKVQTGREAGSGMATGRRQAAVVTSPTGTTAHVVEYKDGEDMTTRSRPGNKMAEGLPATPPTGDAEAKKHVANVKWSARQAGGASSLDGGSKDAAKSVVSNLDGASKDAAKSKTATDNAPQSSERVNKVEAISIKQ